jgi:hypothetical protein
MIDATQDEIDSLLRGDNDEHDVVNSPSHYKLMLPNGEDIEAIEYIQAVLGDTGAVDYCVGSALKYLSRAGRKGGNSREQDLRKAAWFCTKGAQVCEEIIDFDDEPEDVHLPKLTREQVIAIWNQALFTDALRVAREMNEGKWRKAPEED